jgi:AcrR family transcriptional regulator
MARQSRKSTQLERLLKAMVEVTNRRGYDGANVSAVIAEAGVSRPTFYDYFADREDAFRAALEYAHQGLLGAVAATLAEVPGQDAITAAVRRMVTYADEQPALMRLLMSESMAGGPSALEARDRGARLIAAAIATEGKRTARGALVVDLDPLVVVGAVYRMVGTLLRREQPGFVAIADDLVGWLDCYRRPWGECHWRVLKPGRTSGPSPHVPEVPIQQMPALFPPGRPRVSQEQVIENHRLRILYATARLVHERGLAATRVEDITRAASVDGRVFYRQFSDKQDAFVASHELGFQQVMDVTSKGFFSGASWPERSWEGGRALTQLLQANPLVGRVGFVEAYAVGPARQRIEDSHTAFVYFLQEGLVQESLVGDPTRVAMEAIISAIFEIIYLQARSEQPRFAAMLPYIAHLWLTPFMGVKRADAFIERQLAPAKRKRSAAPAPTRRR